MIERRQRKIHWKIDGVVATIMGLDCAIRNEGNNGDSVYDSRGLLML